MLSGRGRIALAFSCCTLPSMRMSFSSASVPPRRAGMLCVSSPYSSVLVDEKVWTAKSFASEPVEDMAG